MRQISGVWPNEEARLFKYVHPKYTALFSIITQVTSPSLTDVSTLSRLFPELDPVAIVIIECDCYMDCYSSNVAGRLFESTRSHSAATHIHTLLLFSYITLSRRLRRPIPSWPYRLHGAPAPSPPTKTLP